MVSAMMRGRSHRCQVRNPKRRGIPPILAVTLAMLACQTIPPSGTLPCATPPPTIDPAAFRIVSLGDSFASGGGAPDDPLGFWEVCGTPGWDDERCNRSLYAPTERAAARLRDNGHDVGHVSFACSGAKIKDGLLVEYDGPIPPPGTHEMLCPQLQDLESLVNDPNVNVDAVTIMAGGNDMLFEYIVMACVAPWWGCDDIIDDAKIDALLVELRIRLDLMKQKLQTLPIDSRRILLVSYPNPAQDSDGSYCDHEPWFDALRGISEEEATWAGEVVLPKINHELCMAAKSNGWIYVDDIAPRFEGHGWCAGNERWVNTIGDSERKQHHHRGSIHPSQTGHDRIGERLAEVIEPMIAGNLPSPPTLCP